MLFKTELTEVFTMAEMDKIVKVLSAKGIDAATKTVDLMSGGLFENRRSSGTFGMNAEARVVYKSTLNVRIWSLQRAFWRQSDRKEGNEVKFIPFFYAYFTDSSKCDKIEAKQKI